MKTSILSLVVFLIGTAFVQSAYAVQIEWTGSVPENSSISGGWGSTVNVGEGEYFLLTHETPSRTAYTTMLTLMTDDVTETLSFKSVSFAMPSGISVSSSRTYEIPPSGFGQPATSYTLNMTFDSFELSVTALENYTPITTLLSETTYQAYNEFIRATSNTFTLGGHYSVVSEGETLASDVFSLSPSTTNEAIISTYNFGVSMYASVDVAGFPDTIVLGDIFNGYPLVVSLDFDDTPFAVEPVIINGTSVTLPLFSSIGIILPSNIELTGTPIPEPSTYGFILMAMLCAFYILKRKRNVS